jgi:hypothetical protein
MNLSFSPDDDAFRQKVRAFIRDHYPPAMCVAAKLIGWGPCKSLAA